MTHNCIEDGVPDAVDNETGSERFQRHGPLAQPVQERGRVRDRGRSRARTRNDLRPGRPLWKKNRSCPSPKPAW